MITIVDCGSQLTQNIARRVRELGVYAEILPFNTDPREILGNKNLEGIIISGGQFSVYDNGSPLYGKELLEAGIPVLGICYGMQSIAHLLGGEVKPTEKREYGKTRVRITDSSGSILLGDEIYNSGVKSFNSWMSHGDVVVKMPPGFKATSVSSSRHIASMENIGRGIFTVQFHPEVDHTEHGRRILENFVKFTDAKRTWDPTKAYERIVDRVKDKVSGKIVVGGVSGGVDSSVGSVLMHRIIGGNYHSIFVDNGLLRLNEGEEVVKYLRPLLPNIIVVDASEIFLKALEGVTDKDQKRSVIGERFIRVFETEARKIKGATHLFQGTLYPDVIESVPIYGSSSKIKRHHNVGGLPERMELELVEPFRNLFKDEVRKIGEYLGVPEEIVWRHPFPGPGLAVRIIGGVTPEKLEILRKADAIHLEELRKRGLYHKISQALTILTNNRSVGVMGDEGTYQYVVAIRDVVTTDFMTAHPYHFKERDITTICNRIINEVRGVNRAVEDKSSKPPATIEWE